MKTRKKHRGFEVKNEVKLETERGFEVWNELKRIWKKREVLKLGMKRKENRRF